MYVLFLRMQYCVCTIKGSNRLQLHPLLVNLTPKVSRVYELLFTYAILCVHNQELKQVAAKPTDHPFQGYLLNYYSWCTCDPRGPLLVNLTPKVSRVYELLFTYAILCVHNQELKQVAATPIDHPNPPINPGHESARRSLTYFDSKRQVRATFVTKSYFPTIGKRGVCT